MKLVSKKPKFKLPDGYQICGACDGWGSLGTKTNETRAILGKDYTTKKCKVCNGQGYLTWLENIFGVNK